MATGRKRLTVIGMPTGASPRTRSSGKGVGVRRSSSRKSSLLSTFGSSRNSVGKSPQNGKPKPEPSPSGNAKSAVARRSSVARRKDSPIPFTGNKMRQTLIPRNFRIHSPAEILNLLDAESANQSDKKANISGAVEPKPKRQSPVVARGNQSKHESSFTKIKPKTRNSQTVISPMRAIEDISSKGIVGPVVPKPISIPVKQKAAIPVVTETNTKVEQNTSATTNTKVEQNTSATSKKFYGSRDQLAEARKSMSKHPTTKKLWNRCDKTIDVLRRSQMSLSPQVRQSRKVKKNDTVFDFEETSPKFKLKKKVVRKHVRTNSQPIWTALSSTKKQSRPVASSFWSGQKVGRTVDSRKSVMNTRVMKPKPVVVQNTVEESTTPDDSAALDNVSVEFGGYSLLSPPHHILSPPHQPSALPVTNLTPAQFRLKPCAKDASTPLTNQQYTSPINVTTLTVDNAFGFEEDSEVELSPVRISSNDSVAKSCSYTLPPAADISNPWRFSSHRGNTRYDNSYNKMHNSSLMSSSLKVGARRDSFSGARKPAKSFTKPPRKPLATINHQNQSQPPTKPLYIQPRAIKPSHQTSLPENLSRSYSVKENSTNPEKKSKKARTRDPSPSVFQRKKLASSKENTKEKKEMQKSFDCMNAHFDDVMGFELVCE